MFIWVKLSFFCWISKQETVSGNPQWVEGVSRSLQKTQLWHWLGFIGNWCLLWWGFWFWAACILVRTIKRLDRLFYWIRRHWYGRVLLEDDWRSYFGGECFWLNNTISYHWKDRKCYCRKSFIFGVRLRWRVYEGHNFSEHVHSLALNHFILFISIGNFHLKIFIWTLRHRLNNFIL